MEKRNSYTSILLMILVAATVGCTEITDITDEEDVTSHFVSETFKPVATYFVAVNGSDTSGDGSESNPWATVRYAVEHTPIVGGHEILLMTGTHPGLGYITTRFETPVLIRAATPYKTTIQNPTGHRAGYLYQARNIIIAGFNIVGNPHWNDDGQSSWNQNAYLLQIDNCEGVILENNVIHDSYNNDVLKLNNYSVYCDVRGNIFYNQQSEPGHQLIDANLIYDCAIEDNIFFSDYPASGRPQSNSASGFIVIKSSVLKMQLDNGEITLAEAMNRGSRNVPVRRNVFLNWFGRVDQPMILFGEDGLPLYEANDCVVENNLFIHNEVYATAEESITYDKHHTANRIGATWAVKGVNNINFRANTVTGFIQHGWHGYNNGDGHFGYALRIAIEGDNLLNKDIILSNNIFSVPVKSPRGEGQLGIIAGGRKEWIINGTIDNNLYYNSDIPLREGTALTAADALTFSMDVRQIVGDPLLETNLAYGNVIPPAWNPATGRFAGNHATIEQARIDLINKFGTPVSSASPVFNAADRSNMPDRDILNRPRGSNPDIGAVELSDAK
jgi:hypothetical protein